MADGFRKSLFGFNCDDVVDYIKKTHKEFSDKETVLNEKIEDLNKTVELLNSKIDGLESDKASLSLKLKQYTDKEDEIKQISENIGKLYIVSQANAKAIIDSAEENRRIASEEVNKNLESIKQAHEALNQIVKGVTDTSVDFTDKIKVLNNDLNETKEKIEKNENDVLENIENLNELKEKL